MEPVPGILTMEYSLPLQSTNLLDMLTTATLVILTWNWTNSDS